jgi:hypothetical protein
VCACVTRARRIFTLCAMTERIEQRYCIKFCQKLGDTRSETIPKIQQAFGTLACPARRQDGALSVHTKAAWHKFRGHSAHAQIIC